LSTKGRKGGNKESRKEGRNKERKEEVQEGRKDGWMDGRKEGEKERKKEREEGRIGAKKNLRGVCPSCNSNLAVNSSKWFPSISASSTNAKSAATKKSENDRE
jgi:hypothetical protein